MWCFYLNRVFAVLVASASIFASCSIASAEELGNSNHFIISGSEASDQLANPFLVTGRPVHQGVGILSKYQEAIERFPTVRECLAPDASLSEGIDLARFNWAGIENNSDIDVCVFRIADSLDSSERTADWLRLQGYAVGLPDTIFSGDLSEWPEDLAAYFLSGYISDDQFEELTGIGISRTIRILWWLLDFPERSGDYAINVYYNKFGDVISVFSRRRGG